MALFIRPVTKENWRVLARLKVRKDQNRFVASNVYSIAQFEAFIIRLMVDEKHQGKGYGRFGMQKLLEIFRPDSRIHNVGISYEPDNEAGRKLYASLGFVETGEMLEGEIIGLSWKFPG